MKSTAQLRDEAKTIFFAGLRAADPQAAVQRFFKIDGVRMLVADRSYEIARFKHIWVVGAGKAAARMAYAVESILPRIHDGAINVKYGHSVPLKTIRTTEAGHPLPDQAGVEGTNAILKIVERAGEDDLVLFLVSGGGSALLPCPADGVTLNDKQMTTQTLLDCGANIEEINAIRKHISRVKGGRLARLAYPATLISLILSDVVGDRLDSIASGPTVPDASTFEDCLGILRRYAIAEKIPPSVHRLLREGAEGKSAETPKEGDTAFDKVQNVIVGSNRLALRAAEQKARELGYHSLILSSFVCGETKEVASVHAAIAREIFATGNPVTKPACVISGGETTVTIQGSGLGGRNQEFVLAAALQIDGLGDVVILSGGTDGSDGPTDAAGALADGTTLARAIKMGLDPREYLHNNDSYHFFQPLGDLLITGPTFTNVMDLRLVVAA